MQVNGIDREYIVHDEKFVKGFFGDYRFLSNFHECPVYFEGLLYPSSENAYQAAKCLNVAMRESFVDISPSDSKKLGRQLRDVKKNWDSIKFDVMRVILADKFHRNLNLRRLLVETGTKYLEETNHWKDTYWGVCNDEGSNNLGRLLMATREFYLLQPAGISQPLF
jgi:ribA/ribD-fused uncharacterized protein